MTTIDTSSVVFKDTIQAYRSTHSVKISPASKFTRIMFPDWGGGTQPLHTEFVRPKI